MVGKTKSGVDGFIVIVNNSTHKLNKLWVDQRRKFCNKLVQKWLDNNKMSMYSIYNEGKSLV